MNAATSTKRISIGEFFSGFFSALAEHGTLLVYRCGDRFNEAVAAAFKSFASDVKKVGLKTSFLINLHPFHGDSEEIEQGLVSAVTRDLISHDNPSFEQFRLKVRPDEARKYLDRLPGGAAAYKRAAKLFLAKYQGKTLPV